VEVYRRRCIDCEPDISDDALTIGVGRLADLAGVTYLSGLAPATSLGPAGMDDVATIAAALVDADDVLTDAGETRLVELVAANTRSPACPRVLPAAWAAASPGLVARVLAIRDPVLASTDRLRWRTTTVGCRPAGAEASPASLLRCLPHALWLDWAVRLGARLDAEASCFRTVAAAALLLPGSSASLPDLVAGLSDSPSSFASTTVHVLRTISTSDRGRVVLRALTQISDALRRSGSPIDYERRRHIAATVELLDRRSWDRICAMVGILTGAARKLQNARLWIWETVTAGLVQRAPVSIRPAEPTGLGHGHERGSYFHFVMHLPTPAADLLEAHARRLLDDQGCGDEPLTWSPPRHWVQDEDLPGVEPDEVDHDEVWRLAYAGNSPREVARRAGTTVDHVRHVVCRTPETVWRPPTAHRRSNARTPLPTGCPLNDCGTWSSKRAAVFTTSPASSASAASR